MKDLDRITTALHYGEGRAKSPEFGERLLAVDQLLLALDDYFIPEWIPSKEERAELRKMPKMEAERERARRVNEIRRDAESFLFDNYTDPDRKDSIAQYCLHMNIKQIPLQKALANKVLAEKLEIFLKMPRREKTRHASRVLEILHEMMEIAKHVQPEKNPGPGSEQRSDRLVPDGTPER